MTPSAQSFRFAPISTAIAWLSLLIWRYFRLRIAAHLLHPSLPRGCDHLPLTQRVSSPGLHWEQSSKQKLELPRFIGIRSRYIPTSSPKITGTPKSSWSLIKPRETDSAMCSKCTVSPFINTPMAMIASNGPLLEVPEVEPGIGVELRPRPPSRSPEGAEEAWTWEAAYNLNNQSLRYWLYFNFIKYHIVFMWVGWMDENMQWFSPAYQGIMIIWEVFSKGNRTVERLWAVPNYQGRSA
jgi:hypothetical protein